ncbi:MAG TPA: hypothetical protein VF812_01450 [Ktedonobacterales bacterium]
MPLVLTINESTASGHKYDDKPGISYEYPVMYRNVIQTGDQFVYYRGSRGKNDERIIPAYLGMGVIGKITASPHVSDCLVCEIVNYQPFRIALPFKDSEDRPFEPGGEAGGRFYQKGVRTITEEAFVRIKAEAAWLSRAAM